MRIYPHERDRVYLQLGTAIARLARISGGKFSQVSRQTSLSYAGVCAESTTYGTLWLTIRIVTCQ
jgi:hypothetical protein